ncbi:MAG TPA: tetratricopeptide repeat protein [Tepidisphaeraceae bacterium]|nr:tetratricopeptide repeat protein [Tepidisphaeraceae bacterium]
MPQDVLQIALEHHRSGRLLRAETGYRTLLGRDPSNADAAHWLGVLLVQAGQPVEAIPLLERAVAARPEDAGFLNNLAQSYLGAGRMNEAVEAFDRALRIEPTRTETLFSAALARLARKSPQDPGEALALLSRARSAGMESPELHQNIGIALLMSGRIDEAIRALQTAVEQRPDAAEPRFHLGVAYRHAGRAVKAREVLAEAVGLQPTYTRAMQALAALEAEAGRPREAESLLRKVIELRPDSPDAYQALGMVLKQLGRPGDATLAQVQAVRARQAAATHAKPAPKDSGSAIAELEQKLALSPEQASLQFQLAKRASIAPPSQIPASSVTGLFDRYADLFDEHLLGKLEYRAPELIVEAVVATKPGRPLDVLDLGCGTGLCGPLLRPLARTLSGVDLSPAMIDKAKARGVYDHLKAGDMIEMMRRSPATYDLLVAADVLMYLGDLLPAFEAATTSLRPGGLFAFSVETGTGERFTFNPQTHRFTHAKSYIQHLGRIFGFREERLDQVAVRREAGKPVEAYRVVLRLD